MLRSTLVCKVNSPGITALLQITESDRLIVAKSSGAVEVYSTDKSTHSFKLFQTYPKLLNSLPANESIILDFLYSKELATIFGICKNDLVLLNSANLHLYDRIIDKRGIGESWIRELKLTGKSDETFTFLVYTTKNASPSKLRLLIWEGRTYTKMLEVSLPTSSASKNEIIKSINVTNAGDILIATSAAIYLWEFNSVVVLKLDQIYQRKYPSDMMTAAHDLQFECDELNIPKSRDDKSIRHDSSSVKTNSSNKSKFKIASLWRSRSSNFLSGSSADFRYSFRDERTNDIYVVDGRTKKLYALQLQMKEDRELIYLMASDHKQFFEWNSMFSSIHYLSSDILLLHNTRTMRFVDYENGFTFLEKDFEEGINQVRHMTGAYFIVWTKNDQIQLYHYQVDDMEDKSALSNDEISICGTNHDSYFYQLWRSVLFYRYFLTSKDSSELCASEHPQESLDVCAMKLRDLTVVWCLQIFDNLKTNMNRLRSQDHKEPNDKVIDMVKHAENVIIRDIFGFFIEFWAPPQLVILKTFPTAISYLVEALTGQEHKCISNEEETINEGYSIPAHLIKKWCIPYLTDTRRHFRNLLLNERNHSVKGIIWKYADREIDWHLDFFLLDKHTSITVETMLALVDTVLFKTYLLYYPAMVGPLIRVDNMCDITIVVEDLKKRDMLKELTEFFFQRKMHKEALEFLAQAISQNTDLEKDQKCPQEKDEENLTELLLIDYLKHIPKDFMDELFYYTKWLCDNESNTKRNAILTSIFFQFNSVSLERDHVATYQFIDGYDHELGNKYLELILNELDYKDIQLQNILIQNYLDRLDDAAIRNKLKLLLEVHSTDEPNTILKLLENKLSEDVSLSEDNRIFLKWLQTYPLAKLGKHERALDILYDELDDYTKCSTYTELVFRKNENEGRAALMYFFKKIIGSRASDDQENDKLVVFLKKFVTRLDIVDIFKELPKSMPLKDLKEYLSQSMKSHALMTNSLRMDKNVLQVELVNVTHSLDNNRSKFIQINENYKCHICGKAFSTFTTDEALWFTMRNGRDYVVHYFCGKTIQEKLRSSLNKRSKLASRTVLDIRANSLPDVA
ncbi:Vam6p KNAG_0D04480 [Huiozyma naganishii CBS 8797]|uniref:Vacuolar sorting protein 39/Transforming growth factor beta receptor-associated domain-containing protein n=1 Tax=Huiozyma naganishii (strain ATCC MYA-139 / BCRC 22969 / CBS 8797 / KCTC 17520 / NBRC 10181 / NCYC 3082 / Yp74L-3) TaxID=1071383 RepID=J7RL15_HUIN7|nr:hypothetical protein KNAG_0D04480 [Kazachstania naganishii CBS 8797]CCK70193.1 hypothetical protein KNAG_0D04480 [Kazachstania naganishii CBS 8797]